MIFRVQKTIINKYLDLVNQEVATESEIALLYGEGKNLYKNRLLTNSDIYRQKLEIILGNLETDLETVKRKRTNKEIKLAVSNDFYQILKDDLRGVDYSKTNLADLEEFEATSDLAITTDNVKEVLENLVILKRRLSAEADLEKFVADQLAMIFGKDRVHRQYSVGGFLALKTDIDIGNGQVGIEVKIADDLSATDMQRMIGQVLYYKKRFYDNNLLVLIASKSTISPTIKELKDFIEELGAIVIFIKAVNL
ncbi:hypothetical protein Q0590_36010 [Rhodocytophaga aerolata]|uniref:DUF91 domain-containing protein n=1 Tax=Rhodocytophaga aerolata TaxID=455078 RepID=A0ABT8RKP6_9BACT|nr:hypothetical protein [Rhodocytophaga aerolata]MDO1451735.1 hypothetical protein [Rhodocytophaga aerolata]